mmetsp:Transcript_8194/g.20456  ORF Transcript_8194/g.20456 Transcript_8194/m.20456 type:complete len:86 (+) Transcript_8194:606-863(+)
MDRWCRVIKDEVVAGLDKPSKLVFFVGVIPFYPWSAGGQGALVVLAPSYKASETSSSLIAQYNSSHAPTYLPTGGRSLLRSPSVL